jgi:Txe/YoeB family toxin of Txe-Axe toxin-antitoxin module
MQFKFKIEKQAKKDLEFFKKNNIKFYEKCFILMEDILNNPEI